MISAPFLSLQGHTSPTEAKYSKMSDTEEIAREGRADRHLVKARSMWSAIAANQAHQTGTKIPGLVATDHDLELVTRLDRQRIDVGHDVFIKLGQARRLSPEFT